MMNVKQNNIDNETKEVIDSFVSEGFDLLDKAESKIINIDEDKNEEVVNTIFRMFHSIKGSAGYLNFENIKKVTHEAETLLDLFRKEGRKPTQTEIDLLYQTCDFLRQLIDGVEKELTDQGFEEATQIIVNDITQCIVNVKAEVKGGVVRRSKKDIFVEKKIEINPLDSGHEAKQDSLITNEMVENYISESIDIIDRIEEKIINFEKNPTNKDLILDAYRNIHTFKGNSGFFGYKDLEDLSMKIEGVFENIRSGKIKINHYLITGFLKDIDTIRQKLADISVKILHKELKETKKTFQTFYKEDSGHKRKLGEILVEMGEVSSEVVEKTVETQNKPIGEILVESGNVTKETLNKALEIQKASAVYTGGVTSIGVQRKDVRVDTSKLDKLFDLVGELIIAGAMVSNNPELKGLKLEGFNKSVNFFNKITRELQEVTMSIRMIPLEGLFTKMIRLVRDLSRKSNKIINLLVYGEDTEMDRTVIEEISDPLVHILRNSIDHGIESEEDRLKKGKEKSGNIKLGAKYEGNEIWVIVEDDGAGLNREKIIKKGIEKGLISGDIEKISDDDIWKLIFEPGFSTAEKVTEISGRGVGMDVVRINLEKIRGKIDIKSEKGKGTTITLKIPLTLAIVEGVTIKVGESCFSIPTIDIIEFFKVNNNQITFTDNDNQLIKVRDEIIPAIKLYEAFNVKTNKRNLEDGVIIVVQSNNKKACLLIDEIIGSQQIVVKSLSDYIGSIKGVSGCSILGNGDVSLIIDTNGLIRRFID
jgi:two-component system, chemotaxis family, sensor kinase CheA